MLKLQLFGGFKLSTDGGQDIPVRLYKDRALLAYLALNSGKPFPRSFLAGFLWGDQAEDKARHSLSQSLSSICDSLGQSSSAMQRSRKEVLIKSESISVDLAEFFNLAADQSIDNCLNAIELYQEGLLSEVDVSEPVYEEWVTQKRIEAQQCLIDCGLFLLTGADKADISSEVDIAQKLIRVDPYCEIAHQHLIRRYVLSGQFKSAQQHYRSCEKLFLDDLGIEPSPETKHALTLPSRPVVTVDDKAEAILNIDQTRVRPSLVIMPIENISGDPGLDFLSLGIADDITTELTRFRDLFVISRETAFGLDINKDSSPSVCRRLGVRHCLRGAFRKIGKQYRINLHLVDGESGQSVWSERYDLNEIELIELPAEITTQIVSRIATWLEKEAFSRTKLKPANCWNAYDHLLKGLDHHHQSWYSTYNLKKAIKHFEHAIKIDAECARAYAYLACAKSTPYFKERDKSLLKNCDDLARHAVTLDPTESEGHRILGAIHLSHGDYDLSKQYFEEAEAMHPGHAHILAHSAKYHSHTGNPDKAIEMINRARQLNPCHPTWYWENLGIAQFAKHNYNAALDAFNRLEQHSFYDQLYVASVNAYLGNERKASHHIKIAQRKNPRLKISNPSGYFPYSKAEDMEHILGGLEKAGLSK